MHQTKASLSAHPGTANPINDARLARTGPGLGVGHGCVHGRPPAALRRTLAGQARAALHGASEGGNVTAMRSLAGPARAGAHAWAVWAHVGS